jgi:hypothetical protein
MRRLGFAELIDARASRERDLVVAMVAERILAPEASKLGAAFLLVLDEQPAQRCAHALRGRGIRRSDLLVPAPTPATGRILEHHELCRDDPRRQYARREREGERGDEGTQAHRHLPVPPIC